MCEFIDNSKLNSKGLARKDYILGFNNKNGTFKLHKKPIFLKDVITKFNNEFPLKHHHNLG